MGNKMKTYSETKVCRICLCGDRKLYLMKKYNLLLYYEHITNIEAFASDGLPQRVCWECGVRLAAAASFRYMAVKSNELLHNLLQVDGDTVPDISTINREQYNLTSSLSHKIFEVNHADYHFVYTEPTNITQEIEKIQEVNIPEIDIETDLHTLEDFDSDEEVLKEIKRRKKKKRVGKVGKVEKVRKVEKVGVKVDKRYKPANEVLNKDIFNITDLSEEQQMYEILKRQYSSNYKNSEYKCDECFKGFLDEDAYKGHINRHSKQCGVFQCHVCKIRFKKVQALRNHATSHTQKFSCKKCTYVTFRRHAAKLHEEFHNGTKYVCPHCLENFDKISTYMSHVRIKHPSDFVCELCGYSFVSTKGLSLHKKLKHRFDDQAVPTDGPRCAKCGVTFINTDALQRHLQLSARHSDDSDTKGPPARRSQYKDRSVKKDTEVKKKRNTCKPEGPISCEQCELQLPDALSYYRHFRRTHPDKNRTKYPSMKAKSMCEVCGKMFQSLALLQDHSWTHTDSKQFKCTICEKRFQRKYRLIAHGRVHGEGRDTHACTMCDKTFTTASNMHRHMVSHTGLKPFKCEMCGKCFKHASEKRVHVTYVHLKKPWPKRARGKRKLDNRQNQLPPHPVPPASEIVQPLWPACNDPKINILMEDKTIYYDIKI